MSNTDCDSCPPVCDAEPYHGNGPREWCPWITGPADWTRFGNVALIIDSEILPKCEWCCRERRGGGGFHSSAAVTGLFWYADGVKGHQNIAACYLHDNADKRVIITWLHSEFCLTLPTHSHTGVTLLAPFHTHQGRRRRRRRHRARAKPGSVEREKESGASTWCSSRPEEAIRERNKTTDY